MTIWKAVIAEFGERIAEIERLVIALMRALEDAPGAPQRLVEHLNVLTTLHRRRGLLARLLQDATDPSREALSKECQP